MTIEAKVAGNVVITRAHIDRARALLLEYQPTVQHPYGGRPLENPIIGVLTAILNAVDGLEPDVMSKTNAWLSPPPGALQAIDAAINGDADAPRT